MNWKRRVRMMARNGWYLGEGVLDRYVAAEDQNMCGRCYAPCRLLTARNLYLVVEVTYEQGWELCLKL